MRPTEPDPVATGSSPSILEAAARLFRERGFDDVTVAEVMSAAGLTHGGFYGHFDSKEALIEAAMAHEPSAHRGRPTPVRSPAPSSWNGSTSARGSTRPRTGC